MNTVWITDETTGVNFEFQAYWHWENVGIGWYDFHGSVEYDGTNTKVIGKVELLDWDTRNSDYENSEGWDVKIKGEEFLVDNYEEIERRLYEVIN